MSDIDINEVLTLIKTLYSPNQDHNLLISAQKKLQYIQKQPSSLEISHLLLQNDDTNVQYFGALTFTVFINNNNEMDLSITQFILDEILGIIKRNLNKIVLKKMFSNVGLLFIKLNGKWLNPLNDILANLQFLNEELIFNYGFICSQIIVEELFKVEKISKELHSVIYENLWITTIELFKNLSFKDSWLNCLNSWISYITKAEFDSTIKYNLNDLIHQCIEWLNYGDLNSLNLIIEVFDINPNLISFENYSKIDNLIFNNFGQNLTSNVENNFENNFEVFEKFGRLIVLYLNENIISLLIKLVDDENDYKFEFLLDLTNLPKTPIIEEKISRDLIDFWLSFSESFSIDSDEVHLVLKNDELKINNLGLKIKNLFLRLSIIYWNKIHLPQNIDFEDFDDFKEDFRIYRRDVGELFESIYPIVKQNLYIHLTESILNNLSSSNSVEINEKSLLDIEASLFLLNSISTIFTINNVPINILESIEVFFNSNYLLIITKNSNVQLIFTTINFLSSIDWFYKNDLGKPYLISILNFLFECLSKFEFQLVASKSILNISDNCRLELDSLVPNYENAMINTISNPLIDPIIRTRILKSYACVIQCIKNPELQSAKINSVLELINFHSLKTINELNNNDSNKVDNEKLNEYLESLLSSLVGLGKGLQLPEEWQDWYSDSNESDMIKKYWELDPSNIHDKILNIINNFVEFYFKNNNKVNLMEEIVNVFKAGLTEPIPGPFVIEKNKIIKFIISYSNFKHGIRCLGLIIGLYGMVIKLNNDIEYINETIDILFFKNLNEILEDPDLIQSSFNMFSDLIGFKPTVLITLNDDRFEKILKIAIQELNSQEKFILKNLNNFWCKLIYLRRGKREDVLNVQRFFIELGLGNELVKNLLIGMFNCERSNLDYYIEILKSLVVKFPGFIGNWLIKNFEFINSERIKNNQVVIKDWEIFIKKLIMTKGNRIANKLIQNFWLQVKGLIDYGI